MTSCSTWTRAARRCGPARSGTFPRAGGRHRAARGGGRGVLRRAVAPLAAAGVREPEASFDRFEPNTGGGEHGGTEIQAFGITVRTGSDGGSLGLHRREQIIRPGRPLYVLGEARGASGLFA